MAQCKSCGKKGLFLSLSKYNLCSECNQKIAPKIKEIGAQVIKGKEAIERTENFEDKFFHTKEFVRNLELLHKLEIQGIKTITPSAKDLINLYQDFEMEYIEETYYNLCQKEIRNYNTYKEKLKSLRELKKHFEDYKAGNKVTKKKELKEWQELIDLEIDFDTIHCSYNQFVDEAKKLEKDGDVIKAKNILENAFEILVKEESTFEDGADLRVEINEWIKKIENKLGK